VSKIVLRAPVERLTLPGDQTFQCPSCRRLCITNAKTRTVQHSNPTCERWKLVLASKSGPGEFLLEAGVVTKLPDQNIH
jgi:hypothetical protein